MESFVAALHSAEVRRSLAPETALLAPSEVLRRCSRKGCGRAFEARELLVNFETLHQQKPVRWTFVFLLRK